MPRKLILFSGLPATGKSTLARAIASRLQMPYFSKDHFESVLFQDGLTEGRSIHSYHLLLATAALQLALGLGCVIDAVFPLAGFRNQARELAQEHGCPIVIVHTFCSNEDLHRSRLQTRHHPVPWNPPTWDDVLQLKAMYEPWKDAAPLAFDAAQPFEENLARLLSALNES